MHMTEMTVSWKGPNVSTSKYIRGIYRDLKQAEVKVLRKGRVRRYSEDHYSSLERDPEIMYDHTYMQQEHASTG